MVRFDIKVLPNLVSTIRNQVKVKFSTKVKSPKKHDRFWKTSIDNWSICKSKKGTEAGVGNGNRWHAVTFIRRKPLTIRKIFELGINLRS